MKKKIPTPTGRESPARIMSRIVLAFSIVALSFSLPKTFIDISTPNISMDEIVLDRKVIVFGLL